jgi:hypothetical protein
MPGKEEEMREIEIVFNLWYYVDARSDLVYAISGRPYCMSGTEQQKRAMLGKLAATDYITATRYQLPENFAVHFGLRKMERIAASFMVRDMFPNLFGELIGKLKGEIPDSYLKIDGKIQNRGIEVLQNPLCCVIALVEDEIGEIRSVIQGF